jgi:plasmid stability protein
MRRPTRRGVPAGEDLGDARSAYGKLAPGGHGPQEYTQDAFSYSYTEVMSSMLQIRNVPEDTRRALKARAATCGKSLNSYLLDLVVRDAQRPTVADVLERASRRAERADASAVGLIAAGRAERDEQLQQRRDG